MTPRDEFDELNRAYRLVFGSPSGQMVMRDLAEYCHAVETCVVPGNRDQTFVLEGRREAFLRIQKFSKLSYEEIYELHFGRSVGLLKHGDVDE